MNALFNIQRLFNVVKVETFAFRRHYFFYVIFAAAYGLATYLLNRSGLHPSTFAGLAVVLFIISPFMLYNDVFHKTKGVNYAMLPASNLEKWLAFWIQNVVFVPIILGALWLFLSMLEYILFGTPVSLHFERQNISTLLIGVLGMQAVSMVGTMSFRRLKWLKTMGAIFVLQVITLIVTNLMMYHFDLKSFIIEMQAANLNVNENSWLIVYIKVIAHLVLPFGLWLVSFFKLQEQEL